MNTKLREIIRFFCREYPHKYHLSNARLTKMVFLADWMSAKEYGKQITDIEWMFDHSGPYSHDVCYEAEKDEQLEVISSINPDGMRKKQMRLVGRGDTENLNSEDQKILEEVIQETAPFFWNDFIRYIYNTEPILQVTRYEHLDLESIAKSLKSELGQKLLSA